MNCYDAEKLLKKFYEDSLSSKEKRELLDHLTSCKDCSEKYKGEREFLTSALEIKAKSEDWGKRFSKKFILGFKEKEARKRQWFYFLQAVALIILVIGMLIFWPERTNVSLTENYKDFNQLTSVQIVGKQYELFYKGKILNALPSKFQKGYTLYSFEDLYIKTPVYNIKLYDDSNIVFTDKNRLLFCFGKCDFSFSKGKFSKFFVDTKFGSILITGTKFTLLQPTVDDNRLLLDLKEGSVKVFHKNGKNFSLVAPIKASIDFYNVKEVTDHKGKVIFQDTKSNLSSKTLEKEEKNSSEAFSLEK